MSDENEELIYLNGITQRTADARNAKGWTQEFVAASLGIPVDRYRKYETRSALPQYLTERFCTLHDIDLQFFMTGKRAPAVARAAGVKKRRA